MVVHLVCVCVCVGVCAYALVHAGVCESCAGRRGVLEEHWALPLKDYPQGTPRASRPPRENEMQTKTTGGPAHEGERAGSPGFKATRRPLMMTQGINKACGPSPKHNLISIVSTLFTSHGTGKMLLFQLGELCILALKII